MKKLGKFDTCKELIEQEAGQEFIKAAAGMLTDICNELANECGWWDDTTERDIPRLLMLTVSELAEAMEGHRKNLMDDHLPHRQMLEVELADALIRIFDMAGGLNLDIAGAMAEKLVYNANREDHKPEKRAKDDGKKY